MKNLKKLLAICLSLTVIVNTNQIVYGIEDSSSNVDSTESSDGSSDASSDESSDESSESSSSSSRSNTKSDSSSSSEESHAERPNWIDNKDEFRHYGTGTSSSSRAIGFGQAEGEYAITYLFSIANVATDYICSVTAQINGLMCFR